MKAYSQERSFGAYVDGTASQMRSVDDFSNPVYRGGGGVFGRFYLSSRVAVQPELGYVRKGGRGAVTDWGEFDGGDDIPYPRIWRGSLRLSMDYITLPVLASVDLPIGEQVTVRFLGGPFAGLRVSNELHVVARGVQLAQRDQNGYRMTIDVSEFTNPYDAGLVAGVELAFPLRGRAVTIGVRYDYGLVTLDSGEADPEDLPVETMDVRTEALRAIIGIELL